MITEKVPVMFTKQRAEVISEMLVKIYPWLDSTIRAWYETYNVMFPNDVGEVIESNRVDYGKPEITGEDINTLMNVIINVKNAIETNLSDVEKIHGEPVRSLKI